jgi:hypothetical protein
VKARSVEPGHALLQLSLIEDDRVGRNYKRYPTQSDGIDVSIFRPTR